MLRQARLFSASERFALSVRGESWRAALAVVVNLISRRLSHIEERFARQVIRASGLAIALKLRQSWAFYGGDRLCGLDDHERTDHCGRSALFLIVFGIGWLLPSTVKNGPWPLKVTQVLIAGTCDTLFEGIYCTARCVKFLLAVGRDRPSTKESRN